MRLPVSSPYKITLGFGVVDSLHPKGHTGVDFSGRYDRKIYAPESGKTVRVKETLGGNCLFIQAASGQHRLAHLSEYLVSDGAIVQEGQAVGIMGETGVATGIHLHWGLKRNGSYVDPLTFVTGGSTNSGVSTVGEYEFNSLFRAYFGPLTETNQPTAGDRKRWIGAETNTVLRAMEVDPRHDAYERYVADMKKAIENQAVEFVPYSGKQLYERKI